MVAISVAPLEAAIRQRAIAGAVVLVANDKRDVLWQHSSGFANVERQIPMRTDSLFWAASCLSKPLTGTAAMILADDGCLDLDAPIQQYLSDWP